MYGYAERDFSDLSDTELRDELEAQRELVESGKQSRNPYYDSGPGELRLSQLEDEAKIRNLKYRIVAHTEDAKISREKAATHFSGDRDIYLLEAEWHDEQVKYWQAELQRMTNR